ncbi:MAG: signal peptide peptidase SppA [Cyanobacteria bacterium SID2]|nr:signal peptide peptidase SppA [Cyanobacteria bacterium SID2]MBP0006256.1 signal peptide peptidase SppA [Cyanobacteria bacterium SBC]
MVWFLNKFRSQVARVEVSGPIAAPTRKWVLEALKTVEARKFKALVLRVDSPGGTVTDSHEIYQALKRLREKTGIKTVASFGNLAASGGVYIGMGAERVVTNPGTITGSIGVILRGNNLERLLDKIGVSFKTVKSGPYKDILAFDRELTEPETSILQELIDTTYTQFVETVAEARNLAVETVREFADGRIFTGQQALSLGLVDALGTEDEARCLAAEMAGLDPKRAEFCPIEPRKPFLSRFFRPSASFSRLAATGEWLEFELSANGLPLWMYHP